MRRYRLSYRYTDYWFEGHNRRNISLSKKGTINRARVRMYAVEFYKNKGRSTILHTYRVEEQDTDGWERIMW